MDQLAGWRTDPGAPIRSILLIVVGLWLCLPFLTVVTGMPWPVAVCLGVAAVAAAVVFVAAPRPAPSDGLPAGPAVVVSAWKARHDQHGGRFGLHCHETVMKPRRCRHIAWRG